MIMANTNVKELKYAGQPVKVEVANRDSSGKVISSTYTTTSSFNDYKNTVTNALNGKANSSHTHSISQVTDLQKILDSKASISAVGAADAKATACQKDIKSIKTTLNDKLGKNETAKESITLVSPNGRISTPDYGATNKNRVYAQIDISSAQMTTNKPAGDGYIWTHFWDNGSWAGQLYIPTGEFDTSNCHLQWRGQNNGVWRSWEDIAWKKEVDTKANLSHKHAITDVTNLQESLVQTATDINNAQTTANNAIASINSTDSEALACSSLEVTGSTYTLWTIDGSQALDLPFKTINGNNIVGTGNVTISASVPTANPSTAGIYKVMLYSPVSTSNWNLDDTVLSGKALEWCLNNDRCFALKTINGLSIRGTGNISISSQTNAAVFDDLMNGQFNTSSTDWGRIILSRNNNSGKFVINIKGVRMTGGDNKITNVTFNTTFSTVPAVFVQEKYNGNTNSLTYRNNTLIESVSTSGCSLRSGKSESPYINLLIIGFVS